jgi:hypothetical protein
MPYLGVVDGVQGVGVDTRQYAANRRLVRWTGEAGHGVVPDLQHGQTWAGASAIHSATAVKDRAPARTAAAVIVYDSEFTTTYGERPAKSPGRRESSFVSRSCATSDSRVAAGRG